MKIREYLKTKKILCDGAFGTYYASRTQDCAMPELANLEQPELVKRIHREYLEAGAALIRTNTFASSREMLGCGQELQQKNIEAAVRLAREAIMEQSAGGLPAAGQVFIAGDIGPVPHNSATQEKELLEEYLFMAETMIEAGVDVLLFETFPDYELIRRAAIILKERRDIFIIMQFQVNQHGYTNAGLSAKRIVAELGEEACVDAIGFNCGVGPAHLSHILDGLCFHKDKFLTALPNASYPKLIKDRVVYLENKEYFARIAADMAAQGVDFIGGCCGTDPSYIARTAELMDIMQCGRRPMKPEAAEPKRIRRRDSAFYADKTGAGAGRGRLLAVEIAPPFHADDEKVMDAANYLKRCRVDAVTFPDSPSGRTRADSIMTGIKVAQHTGMCVMPHICCRDKNAIAIRAQLLGAYMNGIRNLLAVTGDPVPTVMRGNVRSVYNFDSVGLMKIMKEMNADEFAEDPVVYGGALSYSRPNLNVEVERIHKKLEAGASFFLTQPLFTQEDVHRLSRIQEQIPKARILCGVMPLVSEKNALFIKNEMTGIEVPDSVVSLFAQARTREQGEAVGVKIARDIMAWAQDFAAGYYFSIPFNRVYLLEKIISIRGDGKE